MKTKRIVAMLLIALLLVTASAAAKTDDTNELHLIVFAQDADTEIEVRAGGGKQKTETVDAGVTYLSYKAKSREVSVLAYGETIKPRVDKGRDGEWYSIVWLQKPGESVGEK